MVDIDKMEAGRETDLRVAEQVIGWFWPTDRCPVCGWLFSASAKEGCVAGDCSQRPPPPTLACEGYGNYSTDVAAAWEVVEKLRDKGFIVRIHVDSPENSELVSCSLHKPDLYETMVVEWIDDTMPLAVCGAALKLEGLDA